MLNDDLWIEIFKYLSTKQLLECRGVCKDWYQYVVEVVSIRTNAQDLNVIVRRHVNDGLARIRKIITASNQFTMITCLRKLSNIQHSAMLDLKTRNAGYLANTSRRLMLQADDLNITIPGSIVMRWYLGFEGRGLSAQEVDVLSYQLLSPAIVNTDNVALTALTAFPSRNKQVLKPHLKRDILVIGSDKLISIVELDTAICGLWNSDQSIAFIVCNDFYSLSYLSHKWSEVPKTPHPWRYSKFGISAFVIFRTFKKEILREAFRDLFTDSSRGRGVLKGIQNSTLYANRIKRSDLALPWRTSNFRGKVSSCLIVEVILENQQDPFENLHLFKVVKFEAQRGFIGQRMVAKAYNDVILIDVTFAFDEDLNEYYWNEVEINVF